ncbi:MAG: hypothetical protein LBU55_01805 [Elusimicrobiota bacterium]|jgi:hypothetical protein|nr:hypothetical protein [Elusimicrobiota bacterium]
MNNNIFLKKIFVFLFFIVLYIPLIIFVGIKEPAAIHLIDDGTENVERPKFSFTNYAKKTFQQQYETWYARSFFGSNFFLKLKNSVYYLCNLGYFIYPQGILDYRNTIIYGNNLFTKRGYLNYENNFNTQELDKIFSKLEYVQNSLEKIGKKFIFVIAPNVIWANADREYEYVRYFNSKDEVFCKAYFQYFDKHKINYFNAQSIVKKLSDKELPFFLNTNSHWNSFGAGLTVIESLKYAKEKYKTDWDIAQIKEINYSTTTAAGSFINETQELTPAFFDIAKSEKQPYITYKTTKTNNIVVSMLGDSFVRDFYIQIVKSNFATERKIFKYENVWNAIRDYGKTKPLPSMLDVQTIVNSSDLIIFLFLEPIFPAESSQNTMVSNGLYVEAFYDYFSKKN